MTAPSRSFVCSLIGIAMTVLAWFGPWEWPAWPAFALLDAVFGSGDAYHDLPNAGRAAVLIVLIAVNVTFWALVSACVITLLRCARTLATGTNSS